MYASLIDPVTQALRQALDIAVHFDRSTQEREKLRAVLRKLLVIREMHSSFFVCIGGTQGAGKTHLLRELYDLEDWLPDNPGRGECRPLFVLERDCKTPYACGVDELGQETEIDQQTLFNELRSFAAGERFMLLRLYVPKRHFGERAGFLLLPGYEKLNRTNSLWQQEMRDTLKHATGSILVTNANALATQSTQDVLVEMLEQALPGRHPIIAIGRTENQSQETREELRVSAALNCQVPADQADRVVCVGRGEEYKALWIPQLLQALGQYAEPGLDVYQQRLTDLQAVLELELEVAVGFLDGLIDNAAASASASEGLVKKVLDQFRRSSDAYRVKYKKRLLQHVDQYTRCAIGSATHAFGEEEEGWSNVGRNIVDFLSLKTSEPEQRYISRIHKHWEQQGEQTPVHAIYLALTHVADDHFKLGLEAALDENPALLLEHRQQQQPARYLGYEKADGTVVVPECNLPAAPDLQKSVCLLLNQTISENHLDPATVRTRQFDTALKLLPALTMEYLRMSQGMALFQRQVVDTAQLVKYDPDALAKDIRASLPGFTQGAKQVGRALLAITAVDLAIDGSLDVLPVLAGGTATGLGATLSMAATGLMGLGFIGYKAASSVHQYNVAKRNFIVASLERFRDHLVESSLEHYDELMNKIEERIEHNLSVAYGIDANQFSERDALARVMRALNASRRHLTAEIDRAQASFVV
ncbi:hypothetical protein HMH05_12920 [Pseudomonas sp. SbB1]|uniref:Uncharacterized protein n=1 Tax=Pseudomonas putida (strain GB-1) TaxID=76869 RepID=B0KND0_PSEPG|nr:MULTISPECIES: hypothetical protein [Pseudomonas]ABY96670.1 conserved hypothetical protein [Pseudomonas putida GB-1]MBP0706416.1 hypothetical protein [Pseudomonas sp. T34]MCK2185853.1 hypothetical protein [Pseudomonas sp. MB04B]MDD2084969.1 hypothetical protein [Pseudomonas putida]MDD2094942.1 hypothetical protein [Pseudomonas putida]